MAEQVYGLTQSAGKVLGEVVKKHRQRLPDVGRRTRRISVPSPNIPSYLIDFEITAWDDTNLLHGAGAVCRVLFKSFPGEVPDTTNAEGEDVEVAVYDTTGNSCYFGDGTGLVGLYGKAVLMMPVDQMTKCLPEESENISGAGEPTSLCRWVVWELCCTDD